MPDEYNPDDWTEVADDDEPDPGLSATIAAEASPVVERPAGMPTMMPPAMLDKLRRQRADFWKYAMSPDVSALVDSNGRMDLRAAAPTYQALADIEDAFRVVVIPAGRAAYEKWVKTIDDETLLQMFSWYMQEMQPGEAKPSPS